MAIRNARDYFCAFKLCQQIRPSFPLTLSQPSHSQLTNSDVSYIKTLKVLHLLFRLYKVNTEMLPVCT